MESAPLRSRPGKGAISFDLLSPLMDWTETGRAPSAITAANVSADGSTAYTRPVYPYPQQVTYSGQGDSNDAANYVAYTPKGRPTTTTSPGRAHRSPRATSCGAGATVST
jgi:hypothetical protein